MTTSGRVRDTVALISGGARGLGASRALRLLAEYGTVPYTKMSGGYVWPVTGPPHWSVPKRVDAGITEGADTGLTRAETEASEVTYAASLSQVTPVGDVGDPTSPIIRAAHHHGAEVVVIGADAAVG